MLGLAIRRTSSAEEDLVRQAIEVAFLSIIGYVNRAVFFASRGRVVPYRFHGPRAAHLTITGPATPAGQFLSVSYLPDGADYVVVAAETDDRLATALRAATSATIELAVQRIPVDIVILPRDSERAVLLKRLLQQVSIHERHEVVRLRRMPIARLRLHHQPASGGSVAISGIWTD
jgi:hypothetical protein